MAETLRGLSGATESSPPESAGALQAGELWDLIDSFLVAVSCVKRLLFGRCGAFDRVVWVEDRTSQSGPTASAGEEVSAQLVPFTSCVLDPPSWNFLLLLGALPWEQGTAASCS